MKDVYKILHEVAERRSNWIKLYRQEPKEVYINEKMYNELKDFYQQKPFAIWGLNVNIDTNIRSIRDIWVR